MHHDSSSDFDGLAGETVLRVLRHEGLTVDEETVRTCDSVHAGVQERELPAQIIGVAPLVQLTLRMVSTVHPESPQFIHALDPRIDWVQHFSQLSPTFIEVLNFAELPL